MSSEDLATCIGCSRDYPDLMMDDNGETGCQACFTEDGEGWCHIKALAMKLTENQREIICTLAYLKRKGSPTMRGGQGVASCLDLGGSNGSHHSGTASALAKRGLIDHRKLGCEWGSSPTRWRGSKEYRANEITMLLDEALRKAKA